MQHSRSAVAVLLVFAVVALIALITSGPGHPFLRAESATQADVVGANPFDGRSAVLAGCGGAPCPAAASTPQVVVGERYDGAHIVTMPGRYGLSEPPEDESYAVIGQALVRIDNRDQKVLSVVRGIEGPRD